jgi:hypothetical protein
MMDRVLFTNVPGTGDPGTGVPGTGVPGTGISGTGVHRTGFVIGDPDRAAAVTVAPAGQA